MPAEELAPDVLQDVAHFGDEQEEKQQASLTAFIARDIEHVDRRDVAEAIGRDHQPPLNLCRALQELLRHAGPRCSRGKEEKRIDRNQNRE